MTKARILATTVSAGNVLADGEVNASDITNLTKSSIGLENVDNTSDSAKSVLNATNLTGGTITSIGGVISANSSTDALRITQEGTGNALVVEDSANPDATPFVINGLGQIGSGSILADTSISIGGSYISTTTGLTNTFIGINVQGVPAPTKSGISIYNINTGLPNTAPYSYYIGNVSHYRSQGTGVPTHSVINNKHSYYASSTPNAIIDYGFYTGHGKPSVTLTSKNISQLSCTTVGTLTVTCTTPHELPTSGAPTYYLIISANATATQLTAGAMCVIRSIGTTDFTQIGASSNTIGTKFIATGPGTGTGVVTLSASGCWVVDSVIDAYTLTLQVPTTMQVFSAITPSGTIQSQIAYAFYAGGNAPSYFGGEIKVTNIIESTSGGFKFPDGTTQISANLDASKITTGVLDAARLPSYVDDVLEYANLASFPTTGEQGKIYVDLATNKPYRWSGSTYIYITSGAVDSVAGKTGVVTLTSSDVGLGSVDNTSDATKNVNYATTAGGVAWTNVSGSPPLATQLEMESGTETGLRMVSPLRVKQAIEALAPSMPLISTPINTTPAASATNIGNAPTLTGSTFYNLYGVAMSASQWQVSTVSDFATTVLSTGDVSGTSISYTMSAGVLNTNTVYYWRTRYKDANGVYSAWSTGTQFTTAASFGPTVFGEAYGGGYYAGKITQGGTTYYLIVSPKSSGENTSKQWKTYNDAGPAATQTLNNGPAASSSMNSATYPAAQFCEGLTIGGYSDWYMPSRDELELCYRNLKPTTVGNSTSARSLSSYTYSEGNDVSGDTMGRNRNSNPLGAVYTSGSPAQTTATVFQTGNSEAFAAGFYWSSSEYSSTLAWGQHFNGGNQGYSTKDDSLYVRAVRRLAV